MDEWSCMRRRENLFRSGARNWFHAPKRGNLAVHNWKWEMTWSQTKQGRIAAHMGWPLHWVQDKCEGLQHLNDKVQSLYNASLSNEEYLLDTPFTIEELERALHKLKIRKACGLEGLSAEHLKFGGQAILTWLLKIFKSIIELLHYSSVQRRWQGPSAQEQLQGYHCCTYSSKGSGVSHPRVTEYGTSWGWCSLCKPNSIS